MGRSAGRARIYDTKIERKASVSVSGPRQHQTKHQTTAWLAFVLAMVLTSRCILSVFVGCYRTTSRLHGTGIAARVGAWAHGAPFRVRPAPETSPSCDVGVLGPAVRRSKVWFVFGESPFPRDWPALPSRPAFRRWGPTTDGASCLLILASSRLAVHPLARV